MRKTGWETIWKKVQIFSKKQLSEVEKIQMVRSNLDVMLSFVSLIAFLPVSRCIWRSCKSSKADSFSDHLLVKDWAFELMLYYILSSLQHIGSFLDASRLLSVIIGSELESDSSP